MTAGESIRFFPIPADDIMKRNEVYANEYNADVSGKG